MRKCTNLYDGGYIHERWSIVRQCINLYDGGYIHEKTAGQSVSSEVCASFHTYHLLYMSNAGLSFMVKMTDGTEGDYIFFHTPTSSGLLTDLSSHV
jgi:hypothetical protein